MRRVTWKDMCPMSLWAFLQPLVDCSLTHSVTSSMQVTHPVLPGPRGEISLDISFFHLGLFWVLNNSLCSSLFSGLGDFLCLRLSSVQLLTYVWLFATPWTAACQASLYITNSLSLHKLTSIGSVMPSNHLILCHPLLLLPSVLPSIRFISNESVLCIRWPMYWRFSFSITSSNEYSGLISFRNDVFDLLAIQGTLKSLFQQHSSKASILQRSVFFTVQIHSYIHT